MSVPSGHSIPVSIDEPFDSIVDAQALERIARSVLEAEDVPQGELSVLITDDAVVRELNREYAGEDYSTDVLSFSLREGEDLVPAPDQPPLLGEVIISYETAERQARERGHVVELEVAHLLVHGVLHLLGYDHADPEEERRMWQRTEELLAGLH